MQSKLMKSLLTTAFAATIAFAAAPAAHAAAIGLDTSDLLDQEQIGSYFNGGLDLNGDTGPNHGVVFGDGATSIISQVNGGTGDFEGIPRGGANAVFFSSTGNDLVDIANGFTDALSFFYSSFTGGTVDIWSGLDGTGTLLASITLDPNEDHCDPSATTSFCSFDSASASFAGTAESIDFSNAADFTVFGDLTLGSSVPVPEPASIAIFAMGLGALGFARRYTSA